MIFCQCKSNTSKTIVADVKDHNEIVINNSIIKMEELKGMGIDKNILLKHIKLQELAWYGGDFRDDQSKPRYEPTEQDFLLTIPFVEYYLFSHGYRQPTEKLFQDRIRNIFKINLDVHNKKRYEYIGGAESFDFSQSFYAIKDKGFIAYNWLLRDMLSTKVSHPNK